MDSKKAVLVIKGKADKPGLRKAVIQAATMGKHCRDYEITEYIIVTNSSTVIKDIRAKVRKLRAENRVPFDYLLIYAPKEIAKTEQDFTTFCWLMEKDCGCIVKWLKQT